MEVIDVVIKISGFGAAVGAIVALLIKLYKWATSPRALEVKFAALETKEEKDRDSIQKENALIVYGLSACLDGLIQLGVDHNVPAAKDKLDKFINERAHD
ncbi:MAG: hypothetical protein ACOX68_00460 [Candidatus Limivicinus sp.]